jgi:type I site-specific restriction endonuclease
MGDTTEYEKSKETDLNIDLTMVSLKLKNLIEDLRNASITVSKDIKNEVSGLEPALKRLDQASDLLNLIPSEVSKQLQALSPIVAKDVLDSINNNIVTSFNSSIKQCKETLEAFNNQITENTSSLNNELTYLREEVETSLKSRLRQNILNVFAILIVSVGCSAGATYFTLTKFPQTIRVAHSGIINIEQSRVFVDGKNHIKVIDDSKIIKK